MCARGAHRESRAPRRWDPAALCFSRGLGTPTSPLTLRWPPPLVLSTAAVTSSGRFRCAGQLVASLEALTSAARRSVRFPDAAPERSAPGGRKIDAAKRK
ncbi:hypothetical protein MRX96_010708 [Rhipicephalus microplus]